MRVGEAILGTTYVLLAFAASPIAGWVITFGVLDAIGFPPLHGEWVLTFLVTTFGSFLVLFGTGLVVAWRSESRRSRSEPSDRPAPKVTP